MGCKQLRMPVFRQSDRVRSPLTKEFGGKYTFKFQVENVLVLVSKIVDTMV